MARAQPMHMASNTHTWGSMQLRRVVWNSYVRSPTSVTWETNNDRFTIQEPILPIVGKRQVRHYPRVAKKEKQTWSTALTVNQTNKVLLQAKKDTYLWFPSRALASNFSGWLLPLHSFRLYLNLF